MHAVETRLRALGVRETMCSAMICGALIGGVSVDTAQAQPTPDDPFCSRPVSRNHEKSRVGPRLEIKAKVFTPGSAALFRVENFGTHPVGLIGEEFTYERYNGTRWVLDPASPKAFTKQRLGAVQPGKAGFCRSFVIPSDAMPGHYRFSKKVSIGSMGRRVQLTAAFDVRPASEES
jgi:hypothetical protein